jgi:hypothetical protein
MKKNILAGAMLLIVILLLPCLVKSQNCFTRIDPQTGKITKSGVTELTGDSTIRSPRLVFLRTDTELSIYLSFISPLSMENAAVSKMKVLVKFMNGESKVYSAKIGSNASKMPGGTGIIFEGSIPTGDLDYFHDNPISQFLLKFNETENPGIIVPITELNARQITGSLACLSSEL